MLKIRRPLGRLIFNMGITIPGKTVFLIETAPRISWAIEVKKSWKSWNHNSYLDHEITWCLAYMLWIFHFLIMSRSKNVMPCSIWWEFHGIRCYVTRVFRSMRHAKVMIASHFTKSNRKLTENFMAICCSLIMLMMGRTAVWSIDVQHSVSFEKSWRRLTQIPLDKMAAI